MSDRRLTQSERAAGGTQLTGTALVPPSAEPTGARSSALPAGTGSSALPAGTGSPAVLAPTAPPAWSTPTAGSGRKEAA
ncbi:hypothetical protein [Goodfellowiella coeruleoviolacea]|uniref:hypothetical protein n=1 Tax=Goodfellowiella coeruleoviolacea TaxID=334858 RepID=UPI0020A5D49F|nr:hypothetical protein [Goodfellowiella coeruleoviolacea]